MYYDMTFRQLMSQKPGRSWAKIYTQLWNLAMCKPVNKNVQSHEKGQGGSSSKSVNW